MARRPIDPVDTIWLNMDRDNNLMVIESLMLLEDQVDWDRFITVLQQRVLDVFPVFSQRARAGTSCLCWPALGERPGLLAVAPHPSRHASRTRGRRRAPGLRERSAEHAAAAGQAAVADPPDRRVRPRIRGLQPASSRDGRRHGADAGAAVADRRERRGRGREPAAAAATGRGPLAAVAHLAGTAAAAVLDAPRLLTPSHAARAVTMAGQATGVTTKLLLARNPKSAVAGRRRPRSGRSGRHPSPWPMSRRSPTGREQP